MTTSPQAGTPGATPTYARPSKSRVLRLWQAREVLKELIIRDLKLRYEGAVLGYFWTIFEPLLLTAIYFAVFSLIARLDIPDYHVFLILGILPFRWFNSSVSSASSSLSSRGVLYARVYLPRELAPLSATSSKAVEFLASLPVIGLFVILSGRLPGFEIVWSALGLVIQLVFTSGLVLGLSAVNALLRDTERALSPIMRAAFYASPVLYPAALAFERFPEWTHWIMWINPLFGPLELYRMPFYPELFVGWTPVVISGVASLVVFVIGWWLFARLEPKVLKEL